jgi:hypothetical protein
MFFIFFIFSRNTIFGAAEQKCSAEHRLRNPALSHGNKVNIVENTEIWPTGTRT